MAQNWRSCHEVPSVARDVKQVEHSYRLLDHFNNEENLLPKPFRLRLGIHTGESLVDRQHGYAYSEVLDTAGHLQKQAETNGLLASKHTYEALGEPDLMERAGALGRDGVNVYRLRADRLSG